MCDAFDRWINNQLRQLLNFPHSADTQGEHGKAQRCLAQDLAIILI
ncbi:hypothetical protein IQ244_04530 [Nostoc sp. LEGE 06077]|nr:hypothetical protein [Nostoc sp. LEGE 06077]MBE9205788.1 hypothetical protein [Nostoc sp. LEGE 06077]